MVIVCSTLKVLRARVAPACTVISLLETILSATTASISNIIVPTVPVNCALVSNGGTVKYISLGPSLKNNELSIPLRTVLFSTFMIPRAVPSRASNVWCVVLS